MANILFLYNATQTYTQTVFEHLQSFSKFSRHTYHFLHISDTTFCAIDLSRYDGLALHYTVRLPFDQLSERWAEAITAFDGHKALFIQDEYDYTKRVWYWLNRLEFDTLFTVVPEENMTRVYPLVALPNINRVNVLTGYVPQELPSLDTVIPPSTRPLLVAARGRSLPPRYGKLGEEKLKIGQMVRAYAQEHGHSVDIEWSEEARIYGDRWYPFVASSRATLGTESGSNIFDWEGDMQRRIDDARRADKTLNEVEIMARLGFEDEDGLMNQISPRVFEAIALRTVLVLFEGDYSGILEPHKHYYPLAKDGSNLNELFVALQDGDLLDAMAERAYEDVIVSGKWSYGAFIAKVDDNTPLAVETSDLELQGSVTRDPIKAPPPVMTVKQLFKFATPFKSSLASPTKLIKNPLSTKQKIQAILAFIGRFLPTFVKTLLRPIVKRLFKI